MLFKNTSYSFTLDDSDGRLTSFKNLAGREFIKNDSRRPLLEIRLRDEDGNPIVISSNSAKASFSKTPLGVKIEYGRLGGLAISAVVKVRCPDGDPLTYWSVEVSNSTPFAVEWASLPVTVVPNDLVGAGGDASLLYPICEGVLVEDASLRARMGYGYHPVEYPCCGLTGLYPGSVQSQFMAYCGSSSGLYIGAHDPSCSPKSIEYRSEGSGVELEFRLFTGGSFGEDFKMSCEMVLGVFDGDWHAAAEIYRAWLDSAGLPACGRLETDKTLPAWLSEPLTVVTYPVRGTHDMDRMEPNEFYPYTAALKHIDRLAEETQSRLLVLLMHWESTAPWAPPYVWPPFGDQDDFRRFVDELHKRGHKVGLYASGIGWTLKSKVYDYQAPKAPDGLKFEDFACVAPDASLPLSKICSAHREGYDLCPTASLTGDIVLGEILKMSDAGVDYSQYFDQNMGGGAYFCYSKKHGHPPMPGEWLTSSNASIMKRACEALKARASQTIVGCEAAAAEPFIPFMRFNDLRYNVDMLMGKPVPLYAYLYHEKVFNFMGNQVCSGQFIDNKATPDSLLFRMAYSFIAGDIPTLVLKDGGQIHWAWGTRWDVPPPEQKPLITLLRNIAEAVRGPAKKFLRFGRMLKPLETCCGQLVEIALCHGDKLSYPAVISSRWRMSSGEEAQVFINHTQSSQDASVRLEDGTELKFELSPLSIKFLSLEKA